MFSTITKFNKELGDSVLNLNYLLYLIVFTYLIIPNYFTKLTNKFVIYLPKLPFEFNDYLLCYQVICVLTVVTYIISNFGLKTSDKTVKTVIYSLCSIYTCILFIFLSGNQLYSPKNNFQTLWNRYSIVFHHNNLIINISIILIISLHLFYACIILCSILLSIEKYLKGDDIQ